MYPEDNAVAEEYPSGGINQPAAKKFGLLSFRKVEEKEISYVKNLAFQEIGIVPGRLNKNKTYLIYLDQKRIGFISYCRVKQTLFYIYMLALEKEAQNHGLASPIVRFAIRQDEKLSPIEGVTFRIYKTNQQALHVTLQKYNYKIIKERPKYYILYKKWPPLRS